MGLGGNSIHNSSKQRRRWGQEMDNSMVTKEARKKLSQHRVQGSWKAMLASEEMDSRRIIPRKGQVYEMSREGWAGLWISEISLKGVSLS